MSQTRPASSSRTLLCRVMTSKSSLMPAVRTSGRRSSARRCADSMTKNSISLHSGCDSEAASCAINVPAA